MATNCTSTICSCTTKDRQTENEIFLEAIKNCDDETYLAIISILEAKGLLPE